MESLGSKIKAIRKDRNIKAKDVYEGVLSKSMYFKFENQDCHLAYDTLFKICLRLNIELSDLYDIYTVEGKYENYKDILTRVYSSCYKEINTATLLQFAKSLKERYEKTGYEKYRHLYIVIHNMALQCQEFPMVENEVKVIKDYLFNVENWLEYELTLVIITPFFFSLDELDYLYLRVLKTIKRLSPHINSNSLIFFISEIIILCLARDDYQRFCLYIRTLLKDVKWDPTYSLFTRITLKFYSLLYQYMQSPDIKHEKQLYFLFSFLKFIEMDQMFNVFTSLFKYIKKKMGINQKNDENSK